MKSTIQQPSLNTMDKHSPFTLPEDYFEQFAINIDKRIKPQTSIRRWHQWMSVAAIFTGVTLISVLGFTLYQHNRQNPAILAEDYYENLLNSDINEELLVDYMVENN